MVLPLAGRVSLVSGANHGIGAATAVELARLGADVAITYLAYTPTDHDPGRPDAYKQQREQGPESTVAAVEAHGRRCIAVSDDLSEPSAPARIFDAAEGALGPVAILVNNASGWRKDSYNVDTVIAETIDSQLLVDARGGALMIAELARRLRHHGGAGVAS